MLSLPAYAESFGGSITRSCPPKPWRRRIEARSVLIQHKFLVAADHSLLRPLTDQVPPLVHVLAVFGPRDRAVVHFVRPIGETQGAQARKIGRASCRERGGVRV